MVVLPLDLSASPYVFNRVVRLLQRSVIGEASSSAITSTI